MSIAWKKKFEKNEKLLSNTRFFVINIFEKITDDLLELIA
jgi:hypothetical protein